MLVSGSGLARSWPGQGDNQGIEQRGDWGGLPDLCGEPAQGMADGRGLGAVELHGATPHAADGQS